MIVFTLDALRCVALRHPVWTYLKVGHCMNPLSVLPRRWLEDGSAALTSLGVARRCWRAASATRSMQSVCWVSRTDLIRSARCPTLCDGGCSHWSTKIDKLFCSSLSGVQCSVVVCAADWLSIILICFIIINVFNIFSIISYQLYAVVWFAERHSSRDDGGARW